MEIWYGFACFLGVIALAAVLLKLGDLVGRLLKIKGLIWYLLALAGLLFSGFGWSGYARGKYSLGEAIGGTILLGGLPVLLSIWVIFPEIFRAAFEITARALRRRSR